MFINIEHWLKGIIEGPCGLNAFEKYEFVVFNESDRMAAARWTIRCLANPDCEGSAEVLEQILRRREKLSSGAPPTRRPASAG